MKIHCVNHKDSRPSLHVYEDGAWCFVCNYRCSVESLNLPVSERSGLKKQPTDIEGMLRYIDGLKKTKIRGLEFPADETGYYIVWPLGGYYKKRTYSENPRYVAPAGINPPLFKWRDSINPLVIVEGEINALSLKLGRPDLNIISPGSASSMSKFIDVYLKYRSMYCIIDYDNAGVANGVFLKDQILKHGKRMELIPMKQDYNAILVSKGVEGVKEEAESQNLGMPRGV